jgi:hypothetical protein
MATIVLQAAGQGLGTLFGGPVGGIVGRALGAVAGNVIDQQLFGTTRKIEGPRLGDLRVMASSEGAPVPRLWGRMRIAGQVIWATNFEEVSRTDTQGASSKGGGGGTKVTTYSYYANFAVALCEGEIDRIGRVWADGKEIDISEFTVRLHTGTETQEPDSLIAAKEGAGNAPAYRGTAYVVFERLPLERFGNRLPQLSFEVFRGVGGAEEQIRAVNIIPGSTEFGYDTRIVTREAEPGVTETENATASGIRSDWTVSLDQLTATCRNVDAAALVVAWFGTDLRCGSCQLKPGVEAADKLTDPETWSVAGITRGDAHVVSRSGGGPAFGGTPSDASVIRAIQDLRARGLNTVFYPFILMDIAAANARPDPYGGDEQPAYPWRGRLTCSVAPGHPGSPDGSAVCAAEVDAFLGSAAPADFSLSGTAVTYAGPDEWSYRRMVLHYAHLCALAGGVDAFLVGSELRGLTTLRGDANTFPFVAALLDLAAEVKAILPGAQVSYAADWSEYFGYQPSDGTGDVFYHLDPLWASPHVGFVGIDNYMPIADWRDGRQHADYLAGFTSGFDLSYLKHNIAGGEGFDWYYANSADREAQLRSPITDGAYGKPWVFRYKDLKSWWLNAHHDRPGGVEQLAPTAWVPQSKPIWFTEIGCAAIDKGANQPNVFVDEKSSESALPYFSSGARDDLIQNRFIAAVGEYWAAAGDHNPSSALYDGRMVDPARIFWWAWDARPFPFFPARDDIWADGVNYARGHWLNGRIGAVPLGALIEEVCRSYGFADVDAGGVSGLVDGFAIDRTMSARAALEGLMSAYAIDAVESGGLLRFFMRERAPETPWPAGDLVETDPEAELYSLRRAQETELPAAVKLAYVESALDYRLAAVEAKRAGGASLRDIGFEIPAAVGQAEAQKRADVALQESWAARESVDLVLPPSAIALEPGDVLVLDLSSGSLAARIEEINDGTSRKVRARSFDAAVYAAPDAPVRGLAAAKAVVYGKPDALILDLPIATPGAVPYAPWIAATARPWPGALAVYRKTGPASFAFNRLVTSKATMGTLLTAVASGPTHVFDRGTVFDVKLSQGALASVTEPELLQGANVAAVGSMTSGWEILQFAKAELVATRTYRLSLLLRGQSGSNPEIAAMRPAGERFVLLNGAVVQPELTLSAAGLLNTWRIGPSQYDLGSSYLSISHRGKMLGLRPLTPCQLRARRQGDDVMFSWIRRTRIDGDSWDVAEVPLGEEKESYRVDIMDGTSLKRRTKVGESFWLYPAAAIAADFGTDPGVFTLRLAQVSTTFGAGAVLQRTLYV